MSTRKSSELNQQIFHSKPRIDGRSVQKCEASSYKPNASLKCNYVEFGENLSIRFSEEVDATIADFWNDIDPTMVKKRKFTVNIIS